MKPDAPNPSDDPQGAEPRAWLSALADGDAQALDRACGHWRDDAAARQAWHTYHLIGDVMRSEELAVAPTRDAAFLAGVRLRLAAEPVVLAPMPLPLAVAPQRRRQVWLLPAAAVAGFAAVAVVLVVSRVGVPGAQSAAPVMASASRPVAPDVAAVAFQTAARSAMAPTQVNEPGPVVIRDARLDEFLRAHQSIRGGTMVVAPGGTLRRVDVDVPATATGR
jgi:sigma-E factor negative regulatory protein RseA